MTHEKAWEPSEVSLGEVTTARSINNLQVRTDYMSNSELSTGTRAVYAYDDPTSDEATIHSIDPCLVELKERFIAQLNARLDNDFTENIPARRTFVSTERHTQSTADAIAELWYIGHKKANATMMATTQNGVRSAILPLSRRYRSDRVYNLKKLSGRF